MNGNIDLENDTIKIALLTSGYTPDQDSHTAFDDITNEIVTGGGYTTGGATLANSTVSVDNTDNEGVFDADDVTWAASSISNARGAVIYKHHASSTVAFLVGYLDFVINKSSISADFTITFSTEGIVNIG